MILTLIGHEIQAYFTTTAKKLDFLVEAKFLYYYCLLYLSRSLIVSDGGTADHDHTPVPWQLLRSDYEIKTVT